MMGDGKWSRVNQPASVHFEWVNLISHRRGRQKNSNEYRGIRDEPTHAVENQGAAPVRLQCRLFQDSLTTTSAAEYPRRTTGRYSQTPESAR